MPFISDMLTGKIRDEIKKRVDEILTAGREWRETAVKLTEALNRLADVIEKNEVYTSNIKQVSKTARMLAKNTKALTEAFEKMNEMINKNLGDKL